VIANLPFARVILEDFEFVAVPGERPPDTAMIFTSAANADEDQNLGEPEI
jgi:hypothetical protein